MEEYHCENCQYFMQHYVLCGDRLIQANCGHCTFSRPKTKRPNRKACENFQLGEKDLQRFASKEYLSKKLLDRVLDMELLPDIEELPV